MASKASRQVAPGGGVVLGILVAGLLALLAMAGGTAGAESSRAEMFVVSVTPTNGTQVINSTTHSAFYSVSVKNTGDTMGDVILAIDNFPSAGWDWVPIPGGDDKTIESIFPGETKWVSITLYAPIFEKAGTYTLILGAQAKGAPQTPSEVQLRATLLQFGGIQLTAPPDQTVDTGSRVDLPFTIKNTGNGDDTYTITRVDIARPQWTYTITGGNVTGKVKPGFSSTKTIQVSVPFKDDATPPGKSGVRVSVTVISNFNNDLRDGKGTNIIVTQEYALAFAPDQLEAVVNPGSTIEFHFIVTNNGNGEDNITVNLTHSLSGWQVLLSGTQWQIKRDIGRAVILTLGPPSTAIRGDYYLTILARSQGPIDSPAEIVYNLKVTVAQVHNFDLSIAKNTTAPIPPGGVAEFEFAVKNTGNGNDGVNLTVDNVPDGWFVTLDSSEVSLTAFQTRTLTLTVQASPSMSQAPAGRYVLGVGGQSAGNATVVDRFTVEIIVSEICGINFAVAGSDTIETNPYRGSDANFVFTVTNTGNAPGEAITKVESISWDPKLTPMRTTVTPERASVPAYRTTNVLVTVSVPRDTAVGLYDLTVVSSGVACQEQKIPVSVHLRVVHEDVRAQYVKFKLKTQPVFQEVKTYTVELGDPVQIAIGVLNNGSQIVRDVHVKITVGNTVVKEQTITSLGVLKTVVVQGEYSAKFTGKFPVTAEVSIAGDVNPGDNKATAKLNVRENCPPGGCGPTGGGAQNIWSLEPGSPLFLIMLVVILAVLAVVGRVAISAREKEMSKDLYDSIYGGQPGALPGVPPAGQDPYGPGGPGGLPPPPPP